MSISRDEMSRLMDLVAMHRAPELAPTAVAEVFDRLVWCFDDNGHELERVREAWLQSDDRWRVEVALSMQETFPFQDAKVMETILARVGFRWPDLEAKCESVIAARSAQNVSG
jgi:hypothetical protein